MRHHGCTQTCFPYIATPYVWAKSDDMLLYTLSQTPASPASVATVSNVSGLPFPYSLMKPFAPIAYPNLLAPYFLGTGPQASLPVFTFAPMVSSTTYSSGFLQMMQASGYKSVYVIMEGTASTYQMFLPMYNGALSDVAKLHMKLTGSRVVLWNATGVISATVGSSTEEVLKTYADISLAEKPGSWAPAIDEAIGNNTDVLIMISMPLNQLSAFEVLKNRKYNFKAVHSVRRNKENAWLSVACVFRPMRFAPSKNCFCSSSGL
jgi:hypothetical protein